MVTSLGNHDITSATLSHATLWQIRRQDGVIFGFTDHDRAIVKDLGNVNGTVTHKASTGFARSALAAAAGLQVPQMETSGIIDDAGLSNSALRNGLFNGSEVWVGEIDWRNVSGGTIRRTVHGWIGDVSLQDYAFQAELVGLTSKLVQTEIVESISVECQADFKDFRCRYSGANNGPCDKQFVTCLLTFSNILNFRGAGIFTPGVDVLVKYPVKPTDGVL